MGRKRPLAFRNERTQRKKAAKFNDHSLSPRVPTRQKRSDRKAEALGAGFKFGHLIGDLVRPKETIALRSNGPHNEVAPQLTGFKRRPRKPKQIEIEVENGQSLISLNDNDRDFQVDSPHLNEVENGFDGQAANLTIQSPSTSKSNEEQKSSAESSSSIQEKGPILPNWSNARPIHFEPAISEFEIVKNFEINSEDEEESELSVSSESSEESIRTLSHFDDFEYEDIRNYIYSDTRNVLGQIVAQKREKLSDRIDVYWPKVTELNGKRNGIMHDLNKQLKKSKIFSKSDIRHFNARITVIEMNLNSLIPVITKMQARYLKGTDRKFVTFYGYKYAKVARNPGMYSCTYDVDPDSRCFHPSYGCRAYMYLDDKGFLEPLTYIQHYHDVVENTGPKLDQPKIEIAVFDRLTSEGNEPGKRAKMSEFIDKKFQEALDYSVSIREVKAYEDNILDLLEKLKTINVDELEEADINYHLSFIQWMDLFFGHIRIVNGP